MANTLHGPFVKGASSATGSYGTGVGQSNTFTSGNANNDETQASVALHSFNPHMIGAGFVLSGVVCTKDGTTASQLDVASGEAYLIQSDGTPTLCDVAATTFSTTGNPSTTLYLFLNADGSWAWQLSSTGLTNSLAICHVTTDASANIATVTDARPLNPALFPTLAGAVALPRWSSDGGQIFDDGAGGLSVQKLLIAGGPSGSSSSIHYEGSFVILRVGETGATAQGFDFQTWNGSAAVIPFGIGAGASTFAATWIGDAGNIAQVAAQATAGSFGAAVIVAQALNVHVTATTQQTILSYTPGATGLYRVNGHISVGNLTSNWIATWITYTDPHLGTPNAHFNNVTVGGPWTEILFGNTSTTKVTNASVATNPVTIQAAGGSPITIAYENGAGTPNDYVSIVIERLA